MYDITPISSKCTTFFLQPRGYADDKTMSLTVKSCMGEFSSIPSPVPPLPGLLGMYVSRCLEGPAKAEQKETVKMAAQLRRQRVWALLAPLVSLGR